jgi:hypothetical protein
MAKAMKQKIDYSDNDYFAKQYKGLALLKFRLKIWLNFRKAEKRLKETLQKKECYYGPFKGEFGHFLAHNLPFLSYLHSKGVKIHYCGMALHKPFLVDENKQSIIADFRELRDFFAEVSPSSNNTVPPPDVREEIKKWQQEAEASGLPYFNIDDEYYYWFIHRNWLLKGPYTKAYRLDKAYGVKKENSVAVFPRSKGAKTSRNNGGPWDYKALVEMLSKYFDKVYVCGHPSQVLSLEPHGNIEMCVTADNAIIIEKSAKSRLIITQHSGVNNIGEYTDTQVLIIYKGEKPIGSMQNTQRFRPFLAGGGVTQLHPLAFAYSEDEVEAYVRKT